MQPSLVLFLLLAVFPGVNRLLSALISSKRKAENSFRVQIWLQNKPSSVVLNMAIALQSSVLWLFLSQTY
jgi:hypothetical protein